MFIHYSDSNIREKTLLEVLQSPLFMAYHDGRPFNENHLRPCPMLVNPELLRETIAKVGGFPFYKRPKTLHRPKGKFHKSPRDLSCRKKDFAKRKVLFSGWAGGIRTHEVTESKSVALPLGDSPIFDTPRV